MTDRIPAHTHISAGIRRFWQRRRRRRLACLEDKLATQEQTLATLIDTLARLERELQVADTLHGRLCQEIELLRHERAEAEDNARWLRYALDKQQTALTQLEKVAETALPDRRNPD